MQWTSHCVRWQVDIVGVFVWALAPFCLLFLVSPFASLFPLAKRKSGWGICGSSCLVGCWVFLVCCFYRFAISMDFICPCTDVFPAYSHVRTEPLARHRPHSREKKKTFLLRWWSFQNRVSELYQPHFRNVLQKQEKNQVQRLQEFFFEPLPFSGSTGFKPSPSCPALEGTFGGGCTKSGGEICGSSLLPCFLFVLA